MSFFTTFNILVNSENTELVQRIEEFTGSRLVYGLNTPIYIADIATNLGLETGTTALYYATESPIEAAKTIALEWIKAHLSLWNSLQPGNNRILDLTYYLEQYRLSTGTEIEPRLDYCGDPIPGSDANIWLAQINSRITLLTNLYNSIDPGDYSPPVYEFLWANSGPGASNPPPDFTVVDSVGRFDPTVSRISNIPDYPGAPPPSGPPITGWRGLLESIYTGGVGFDPQNSVRFYTATYQNPIQDGTFDQTKESSREFIDASLLVARMVTGEILASLTDIYHAIVQAHKYYASQQQINLDPLLARLREMAVSGGTPAWTTRPEWEIYLKPIEDAEQQAHFDLLNDPSFVSTYGDPDSSGTITESEFIDMEVEIGNRLRVLRRDLARATYDSILSQYTAWNTFEPSLLPIFLANV